MNTRWLLLGMIALASCNGGSTTDSGSAQDAVATDTVVQDVPPQNEDVVADTNTMCGFPIGPTAPLQSCRYLNTHCTGAPISCDGGVTLHPVCTCSSLPMFNQAWRCEMDSCGGDTPDSGNDSGPADSGANDAGADAAPDAADAAVDAGG